MLFNSYIFIYAFLPTVFIMYFVLNKLKLTNIAMLFLSIASLYFYSYWSINYLPLIIFSIIFNYFAGKALLKYRYKWLLIIGIVVNLGLLGFYKYADFFIDNVNTVLGTNYSLLNLLLPLAISFFTFQQIAFLVDTYKGVAKGHTFLQYVLFITFFPQLIAGPIVQHREMIPQFVDASNKVMNLRNIAMGLFVFFMGLFKKVVIADSFAIWATQGFDHDVSLTFIQGWVTSLSYTFQLYFDFSGYTDMAIGAALLFNIKLPINFNSPYKALNIRDFWNRWHMTLGRFLTHYLYIPLGGNRKGKANTYINLFIVFLISGLWHGAGWTFVFWGVLHGLAMIVHRIWSDLGFRMNKILAWIITFNFINITWVFFRAKTWDSALKVLDAMFSIEQLGRYWLMDHLHIVIYLFVMLMIVVVTRNSIQQMNDLRVNWRTAFFLASMTVFATLSMDKVSEFLYFNF